MFSFSFLYNFSQVYCYGELLHTVQMSHLFEDSKTFTDMKMKLPPEQTIANFHSFMKMNDQKPTKADIQIFVEVRENLQFAKLKIIHCKNAICLLYIFI